MNPPIVHPETDMPRQVTIIKIRGWDKRRVTKRYIFSPCCDIHFVESYFLRDEVLKCVRAMFENKYLAL